MFHLLWPDWSDFILIYRLSLTEKVWNLPIICQSSLRLTQQRNKCTLNPKMIYSGLKFVVTRTHSVKDRILRGLILKPSLQLQNNYMYFSGAFAIKWSASTQINWSKKSVYIRKKFMINTTAGRRDVMWKQSIFFQASVKIKTHLRPQNKTTNNNKHPKKTATVGLVSGRNWGPLKRQSLLCRGSRWVSHWK